jgi:hypothetical protein
MRKRNRKSVWTAEMDDFLRDSYGTLDDERLSDQIYEKFGVFLRPSAVAARRNKLGLLRYNKSKNIIIQLDSKHYVSRLKIGDNYYKINARYINKLFVVATLDTPYIICVDKDWTGVLRQVRAKVAELLKDGPRQSISMSDVKRIRKLYGRGVKLRKLAVQFHVKLRDIQRIVANRLFVDPDYKPPRLRPEECLPNQPIMITIEGETKSIRDWGADDRCEVAYETVYWRYRQGKEGLDLLRKRSRVELEPPKPQP